MSGAALPAAVFFLFYGYLLGGVLEGTWSTVNPLYNSVLKTRVLEDTQLDPKRRAVVHTHPRLEFFFSRRVLGIYESSHGKSQSSSFAGHKLCKFDLFQVYI